MGKLRPGHLVEVGLWLGLCLFLYVYSFDSFHSSPNQPALDKIPAVAARVLPCSFGKVRGRHSRFYATRSNSLISDRN